MNTSACALGPFGPDCIPPKLGTAGSLGVNLSAAFKREQSMKQNGSLCSVIAGNLAEVSLATQTWFVTEDEQRRCCYSPTATASALFSHQLSARCQQARIVVTRRRRLSLANLSCQTGATTRTRFCPQHRHYGWGTGRTRRFRFKLGRVKKKRSKN